MKENVVDPKQYRSKPVTVEAYRWMGFEDEDDAADAPSEDVVLYGNIAWCPRCELAHKDHGMIDDKQNGGSMGVCPGDWVVTRKGMGKSVIDDKIFRGGFQEIVGKQEVTETPV